MLRRGIWVGSCRCAGNLLLQWQFENFAHRQHLKFCHFQHIHCASKYPISPKVFNRFSKSLPQLEDVEGGHVRGEFQVCRYFTFAMAKWQLYASTTFEILQISTCTLCQKKSYITKGIQPIFEIYASARRRWGLEFGWKDSGAQAFYFWNGKVKTLPMNKIWNFATFNLYTLPAKILYLQRYSTDLEIFASARRCWGWAFAWNVSDVQVFYFCNGKVKIFPIDYIWNFRTFNLYTVPPKILYLQRCSTDFRNLCLSSKMLRVGIWAESLWCAGMLLLQWKAKTLPVDYISNFATSNLYTVPAKILHLQRYSTDFRNLCLSSKRLRVGSCAESLWCAGILLLQWKAENFAHRQHLKFCHFQPVVCVSKNPISPKVITRFSKSLPQLDDVEGGHLGGKFQERRYFTLAMARWKFCASTTFEILPLSTCTLCQQKSYISKGIQPILEILFSARRSWGWALGRKVSCAHVFYFWNGKAKTLHMNNIWNFATFNLHTATEKILYLQRYLTDFRNRFLSSKMLGVGIWVGNFSCAGILLLQWQFGNFAHRQHLKFCHFQQVHCASKNPISPEVFNRFWKSLPQLEDVEGGHLRGKFKVCRYFTFAMAKWPLHASTAFEILQISTCTPCQQKSYISKGIQAIFEIFASARRCGGLAFGWKVSGAQVFYFCNAKVETWRIDNIWNFATFNLNTVPAKVLYLQRYSKDFRNLSLSAKILRVGILLESFSCAGIFLFQWQFENFAHRQHLNFCHFQPVHCASKNPTSPKVFNRLSKSLPQFEEVECGKLGGKFVVRRYFTFAMERQNFARRLHLKFCHFQPVHCASKNPISPKVFNRF